MDSTEAVYTVKTGFETVRIDRCSTVEDVISLAKIDGAPAPGKFVLFSRVDFPPGTIGGGYMRQGKWSTVSVHRDGRLPDGKCQSIADGRVWIDALETPLEHISGKYEIKLNGELLKGDVVARRRERKHLLRLCIVTTRFWFNGRRWKLTVETRRLHLLAPFVRQTKVND